METEKILVEMPKFFDNIDLTNLRYGVNTFRNKYFILVIYRYQRKIKYYARFHTPSMKEIYDFVLQHERSDFEKDHIEIFRNQKKYSVIPMELTEKMRTVSKYNYDWKLIEYV